MAADLDLTKISLDDRLTHKVWKARVNGYEELVQIFKRTDDETSSEFSKYLGFMKKMVVDNNAVAQDKGLEAVLAFLEGAAPSISGRVAGDVICGCITKCLNARTKTKEKGIEIILMYVEVEKQDIVQEELLKGLENKQPKIVAACINVFTQIISLFGGKIFLLKPIVKVLPKLFDHSDKSVREEAKLLAIEIYQWIRDALRQQLQNIKPVQLKELDEEWGKLPPAPPAPTRLTRTQQKKLEEQQAQGISDAPYADDGGAVAETIDIDPYEMMDAVEILSKLPKDFYENLEAKKWQTRKEALEALEKLASNPKLEGGQYGELMSALKKIISKDANVMVVTLAAKCVAHLATGLRKKFSAYSAMMVSAILDKFKEKKTTVVTALRDAIDAVYLTTTLPAMQEDLLAALDNKNPSIKEETAKFLTRTFCKSVPSQVPKAFMKPICANLVKKMDDTAGPVRDAVAESLGTLTKLIGEKAMTPYIDKLDKLKADKVKEFADKAEIKAKPGSGGGGGGGEGAKPVAASKPAAAAPASKPAPPPKKKPAVKAGGKKAGPSATFNEVKEPELTDEDVQAKAADLFPADLLEKLAHTNWKERMAGMEELHKLVESMDDKTMECQVLIRVLGKKPGWKDNNFQVLKSKFQLCGIIAGKGKTFSSRSAEYAIPGLVEKIGDIKLKDAVKETLMIISEKLNLGYVSLKVSQIAGGQKNPKVISESLSWLGSALKDFGFKIDLKPHVQYLKDALANTNPAVRTEAISLIGVLHMYVGPTIRVFFEEEKAALLSQIDDEIAKVKDEKPPAPTRGLKPAAADGDDDGEEGGDDAGGDEDDGSSANLEDLIPRNDISNEIKPDLIDMLADKNWKVRGEGLQKVQEILAAAKFITPDLGDLPSALKARLGDSNKNLVITTLNICGTIATAMGANVKRHFGTLGPAMFSTLADAKPHLRAAGITALNAWHKEIGMVAFIEGEILFGALSTENPFLRIEVLGWLEEKLPGEQKLPPALSTILPPMYSCLEDRNGDVRKKAQAAVPAVMAHLGYDVMLKQANKLKPASKPVVVGILEKLRGTVPEPAKSATKTSSKSASSKTESASTTSATPAANSGPSKRPKSAVQSSKQPAKTSKKKANVEEETGPPLIANNEKDKRIKDEKDLKVMKWNFSTPRDEFIEQLKEQMSKCFSKTIMSQLFHPNDFKQQLKAIATLQQVYAEYKTEAMQSLDMILKYLTLRFFDTNTTVLIKCLEFLVALFTMLAESDYQMLEHEASSFIPYLVTKVGDPKDVVRKMIRSLFKLITKVYPASKMFNYVSEGISSKNSKTRMECLEELGCLIQVYGMNVCQPTPPKAIAAIASQIGDRDNGVRNAALNAVVEAYFLVGETVYKYAGRLNDKDMSLLEERIKRSAKNRPSTAAAPEEPKPVARQRGPTADNDKKPAKAQPVARPATAPALKRDDNIKREFALDYDTIEGGSSEADVFVPNLVSHESVEDLISEPIQRPTTKTPSSPHLGVFSRTSAPAALNYVISQIASNDIMASTQALVQLEVVLRNKSDGAIVKHVDQFLNAAALQLNIILTTHIGNEEVDEQAVTRLLNCLVDAIMSLFANPSLAAEVSRDTLKHLVQSMLTTVLDDRLVSLKEGTQIIRTFNVLMAKIIDRTNPTVCMGALIRLLQDSVKMLQDHVGNSLSSPKFVELIMKGMWKMVRSLPKTIKDVNAELVLLDIHKFLVAHPPQVWRSRADDTPLRTIRSVLHSLAKLKGIDILGCTNLIEDAEQSEVYGYLHKALKTGYKPPSTSDPINNSTEESKNEKNGHAGSRGTSVTKLNEKLAEIFRMIASKENTREGLAQLYDLKLRYPQADTDPFLQKTSPFFRNYIERGLRNIEMERKGKKGANENTSSSSTVISNPPEVPQQAGEGPAAYMDRLRILRMKSGLGNNTNMDATKDRENNQKPISQEPTEENKNSDTEISASITTQSDENQSVNDPSNIQDIKRRLERIKMAARN
ncbi:predicted protein [Nematostella vectensis]|uniref:TOG domain-containing protein n=1 Tax=Nematostella vectensis TaxID=45351 RepID=A7RZB8_NEMVE|nr:predicted protein [Nematostella vectensis]|eukprot:XP_001635273.1 predicted protein [Nematostella vectensis]